MDILSGKNIRDLMDARGPELQELVFLEPFTWEDGSSFMVKASDHAIAFYRQNPIRSTVQYAASDAQSLLRILREFHQELTIKLDPSLSLNMSPWYDLGTYRPMMLDLQKLVIPNGLQHEWGVVTEKNEPNMDQYLMGPERILLRTLDDCMFISGKNNKGFGFCAFRLIDKVYMGMYLFNQGLSVLEFSCLIAQALTFSRSRGILTAQTIVHQDNIGAKFLHQSLGFLNHGKPQRVWSNFR
jgi:hypothetical protein